MCKPFLPLEHANGSGSVVFIYSLHAAFTGLEADELTFVYDCRDGMEVLVFILLGYH